MEQPILIQGAMDVETNFLIDSLENKKSIIHSGYQFYQGIAGGHPLNVHRGDLVLGKKCRKC